MPNLRAFGKNDFLPCRIYLAGVVYGKECNGHYPEKRVIVREAECLDRDFPYNFLRLLIKFPDKKEPEWVGPWVPRCPWHLSKEEALEDFINETKEILEKTIPRLRLDERYAYMDIEQERRDRQSDLDDAQKLLRNL